MNRRSWAAKPNKGHEAVVRLLQTSTPRPIDDICVLYILGVVIVLVAPPQGQSHCSIRKRCGHVICP
jgi:hypothetical protein